jgi:hypothetical protein
MSVVSTQEMSPTPSPAHPPDLRTASARTRQRLVAVPFLSTLLATDACGVNATPSTLLHSALYERATVLACATAAPITTCMAADYSCFTNGTCRECLGSRYELPGYSPLTVKTQRCADSTMWATDRAVCHHFPRCSYAKAQCDGSSACRGCLATMVAGEPAAAAVQCPIGESAKLMDVVAESCVYTPANCAYWRQRCATHPSCGSCLDAILDGPQTPMAIVDGMRSDACAVVRTDPNVSSAARLLLYEYVTCHRHLRWVVLWVVACPHVQSKTPRA